MEVGPEEKGVQDLALSDYGRVLASWPIQKLGRGWSWASDERRADLMRRNFRLVGVGVAMIAVFAFSAMAVASVASAAVVTLLAEWLLGAKAVEATLAVEGTGEVLLEDKKATLGIKAMVLCSGIFVGTIGPNGEGQVTELLTLAKVAVSKTPLSGTALLCSGQEGCNTGTENDEVWPVKLPGVGLLELVEETGFTGFAVVGHAASGSAGWYVQCATALGTTDDECLGEQGAGEATNGTSGVLGRISEAFTLLMEEKLANCTASSEKETGNAEETTPGELKVVGTTEVLSVSSTG